MFNIENVELVAILFVLSMAWYGVSGTAWLWGYDVVCCSRLFLFTMED